MKMHRLIGESHRNDPHDLIDFLERAMALDVDVEDDGGSWSTTINIGDSIGWRAKRIAFVDDDGSHIETNDPFRVLDALRHEIEDSAALKHPAWLHKLVGLDLFVDEVAGRIANAVNEKGIDAQYEFLRAAGLSDDDIMEAFGLDKED